MKKLSVTIYCLLFTIYCLYAGTDPSAFLKTGVGARALGLGGAFASVSDDATAIYWNPAGLARVNRYAIMAMGQSLGNTKWESLKDITPRYQFTGVTIPVTPYKIVGSNNNVLGLGWISCNLNNIPHTSVDELGRITRDTFENAENAYFVSYACSFFRGADKILAGITVKYITQTFSNISLAEATGYDIDFGTIYTWDGVNFGLVVQRGVTLNWANGHSDHGPFAVKFGISNKFKLSESFLLLGSMDFVQRHNQPLFGCFGTELEYKTKTSRTAFGIDGLYLRGGLNDLAVENRFGYQTEINNNINLTLGAGIKLSTWWHQLQFDYAFGFRRLGNENRFSMGIYF